jgi:glutathione peroxidase
MWQQFRWNGFVVLAFPSNTFNQEPLEGDALGDFYRKDKGCTFPVFGKVAVNGSAEHPLFQWLKAQPNGHGMLGDAIKWNFTMFLVDRKGQVLERFAPSKSPVAAAAVSIQKAL